MKRAGFAAALLLVAACFTGCASHEKNVVLQLEDGSVYHTAKVDGFGGEWLPAYPEEQVPGGMEFLGWGLAPEQTDELLEDRGYVNLSYLEENSDKRTVILYPVFGEKLTSNFDLVVGWYNLPATSGMTQEIADRYEAALREYLESIGKGDLNVDVRGYEGNVAATGGQILQDDDVDVLIGWGSNLTSKGGVQTVERTDSVRLGAVDGRYIDLISEDEIGKTVYDWTVANAAILAN